MVFGEMHEESFGHKWQRVQDPGGSPPEPAPGGGGGGEGSGQSAGDGAEQAGSKRGAKGSWWGGRGRASHIILLLATS